MIARSQERFARDATHIEASATQLLVLFDEGGFQTELTGTDRSNITARSRANDNNIKFFHTSILSFRPKWRNLSLQKGKEQEMSRLRSTSQRGLKIQRQLFRVLDVAINYRHGFKSLHACFNKERHQTQFDPVLFRELLLSVSAQFLDDAHVAFIESREDRCGMLRHHELLRDLATQRRHLFAAEPPVVGWFNFARLGFLFRLRQGYGGQVRLATLLHRCQDITFC